MKVPRRPPRSEKLGVARRTNNMNTKRIVPDITSGRIDESRKFYTEFLGLELAMDMGWILTFVAPNNPAAQVTLLADPNKAALHPQITIEVSDIDAFYADALAKKLQIAYPITNEPWGVRRFFVVDPNGAIINIMSHR